MLISHIDRTRDVYENSQKTVNLPMSLTQLVLLIVSMVLR